MRNIKNIMVANLRAKRMLKYGSVSFLKVPISQIRRFKNEEETHV
jgi:hypothetical protein